MCHRDYTVTSKRNVKGKGLNWPGAWEGSNGKECTCNPARISNHFGTASTRFYLNGWKIWYRWENDKTLKMDVKLSRRNARRIDLWKAAEGWANYAVSWTETSSAKSQERTLHVKKTRKFTFNVGMLTFDDMDVCLSPLMTLLMYMEAKISWNESKKVYFV